MKTISLSFLTFLFLFCSITFSQTIDFFQSPNSSQRIYREDGSLIEIKTLLEWTNNQWENSWRSIYSYDTENKLVEELDQGWQNNIWNDVFRVLYSYDTNNNLVEMLAQYSSGSNYLRYLFSYDASNKRVEEIRQMWSGNNWDNDGRVLYTYNNNDLTEEIIQEWDGSEWINTNKNTYSYLVTDAENIEESVHSYGISNNFPNPFNPSTKIRYFIPEVSFVTIKVYDVLGNEISTLVNEEKPVGIYEVEFEALNFPSGVYFYQLKAGSFVETKKMILMK